MLDNVSRAAPPVATTPPSTAVVIGEISPYSNVMVATTRPLVQVTVRARRWARARRVRGVVGVPEDQCVAQFQGAGGGVEGW